MAPKNERFELRLDEELLERVDNWRVDQSDIPSRAEAMRRLMEVGLSKSTKQTAVKFSDGEKLMFMMFRDVYKHLKISGETNVEFIAETIYGGHYWAPKWEMNGLFHDHEDNLKDVNFVVDVLDMWSFIEEGYASLDSERKALVELEAAPFGKDPKFNGFDGNNESSHMSIARFFVEKMDRFSRFKKRDFNSHHATLAGYSRMLKVFEPIRAGLIGHGLNAAQIISILNARRYPA